MVNRAIAFALLLPSFVAIGSVNQWVTVPYAVVVAVFSVTVLVAWGKINQRYYPIYIFGLALSLIWQTSMIGTYFVGVDIHSEYMVVLTTIESGWDWAWGNIGNTSIVLTVIAPFLAKLGFDPIWQFKILYPFMCAFVPVVLYFAFKNIFGGERAYFGALFFMMMPMFTMEAVSMVKTQVAYLCVAGLVWTFTSNVRPWHKALLVFAFGMGAIMSHYTVGIIVMLYLIGIFGVLAVTNWGKVKTLLGSRRIPMRYGLPVTALVVGFFYLWFSLIGGGGMIGQVKSIFNGVYTNLSQITLLTEKPSHSSETRVVGSENETSETDKYGVPETITQEELPESEKEKMVKAWTGDVQDYTQPIRQNTYLDRQPKLIRAAIGIDFMDVSLAGKVFRVFQYITEVMLVVGLWFLWQKRKEYDVPASYMAGAIGSFILLGCSIFVPYFTVMTVTTTRLYAVTLFFIAPLLVVGMEGVLGWVRK